MSTHKPKRLSLILGLLIALLGTSLVPTSASAGLGSSLFRFGQLGSGAGELSIGGGGGIAANPSSGHLFVSDLVNNRISEFTAWGEFIKAWGWGVRDGAKELQTCTTQTGCQKGLAGPATGQLNKPNGIALTPSGEVQVFEQANLRLQKFDSAGNFRQAVGGDVVAYGPGDSSNDEVQEVTVAASSGTFTLGFEDPFNGGPVEQTAALPFNASAAEVQGALNALPTIGGLGGSVSVSGGPGNATGSNPFTVTFKGNLGGDDVPRLTIDRSTLGAPPIGARLVCSSETDATSVSYRWLRNGVPIPGATAVSYTTTAADEGKPIQCQVFGLYADGGMTEVSRLPYIAPPASGTFPPVAPKAIRFFPNEFDFYKHPGSILSCDPLADERDLWEGAVSFSYEWYRNGAQIPGASSITYVTTASDLATPADFQCVVTAKGASGLATTRSSSPLATKPEPTSRVTWVDVSLKASLEPVLTTHQGGAPEVCTAASGDVCKGGTKGSADGQFSVEAVGSPLTRDYLDIGPDGTAYVGDRGRVQEFEADGSFKTAISLPKSLWFPAWSTPSALSVDRASADIYLAFSTSNTPAPAYRLSPAGEVLDLLPTTSAEGFATDASGILYASDDPDPTFGNSPESNPLLREISPSGELLSSCCSSTTKFGEGVYLPALATNIVTAAGATDLYVAHGSASVSFIEVRGAIPDKWPPPLVPPSIGSQYASSVRGESAVLKTEINPNFWSDTRYHVEYGAADCASGGCAATSERSLNAGIVKEPLPSEGIALSGLSPATTYHYRFVAESGGGTAFGPDQTFTTYPAISPPSASCPNQAFRTGSSAALGDCRAFEQVSPVDKAGGDIAVSGNINSNPARLQQASPSGEKITYSSYRPFGDVQSAPFTSQYMASRGAGGWTTNSISPPRESLSVIPGGPSLDSQYKGFLEDLSSGWLAVDTAPLLAPGAVPDYLNLYRRDFPGTYEALSTVMPPVKPASFYRPELQGFSADGKRAVFSAEDKLTPNALSVTDSKSFSQLYESFEGELRLVSVLPNGKASGSGSTLGSFLGSSLGGRETNVEGAVSSDGLRIYWSAAASMLYLRNEGVETIPVSAGKAAATFWAANPDGSKAIFTEGAELKRFDLDTRESTTLAAGVQGVMGASEDLSRVYFASSDVLAGAAEAGKPNLYLYEEGGPLRFIATLSASDLPNGNTVSPIILSPRRRVARVNADGSTTIFMSRASLTGSDNIDAQSNRADAQVFRYDADSDELDCVSCNPTGARPVGDEYTDSNSKPNGYRFAGQIPGWELQLHAPRALSAGGERVFFNSTDRLTLADTNGVQDVYQWQAPGSGECSGSSARGFNPKAGGCVTLISDGQGSAPSEFVDASAGGSDVFFLTGVSLLAWDPGQIDIYDARVNGGFPPPPSPPAGCEGEACQNPVVPPPAQPFSSQTFKGPGNPPAAAKKKQKQKKKSKKKQGKKKQHKKAQRATGGKR